MVSPVSRHLVPNQYGLVATKLIEVLELGQPGDVLTYAELSKVAGKDVREGAGASSLRSARRYCMKAKRIVWSPARGDQALKCLADSERLGLLEAHTRARHRSSARDAWLANAIDAQQLTVPQRQSLQTQGVLAATVALMTHGTAVKQLESGPAAFQPPSLPKLLEIMRS